MKPSERIEQIRGFDMIGRPQYSPPLSSGEAAIVQYLDEQAALRFTLDATRPETSAPLEDRTKGEAGKDWRQNACDLMRPHTEVTYGTATALVDEIASALQSAHEEGRREQVELMDGAWLILKQKLRDDEALLRDCLEAFEVLAIEPKEPDNRINYLRHTQVLGRTFRDKLTARLTKTQGEGNR